MWGFFFIFLATIFLHFYVPLLSLFLSPFSLSFFERNSFSVLAHFHFLLITFSSNKRDKPCISGKTGSSRQYSRASHALYIEIFFFSGNGTFGRAAGDRYLILMHPRCSFAPLRGFRLFRQFWKSFRGHPCASPADIIPAVLESDSSELGAVRLNWSRALHLLVGRLTGVGNS